MAMGRKKGSLASLRRSSRTHWPAWRVVAYVAVELVVAALVVLALVWLLGNS